MLMTGMWGGGEGAQLGKNNANSPTALLVAVFVAGWCRSTTVRHCCSSDFIGRYFRGADRASILFCVALLHKSFSHPIDIGWVWNDLSPFLSVSSALPSITRGSM
ncbi:unnamed protein product [Ectocarpus sp. 6 AP-2014]